MNNRELMILLQQKKEDALSQLIEQYCAYVTAIVCNLAGGRLLQADIEEVCADVFVSVWRAAERLHGDWLYPPNGSMRSLCKKSNHKKLPRPIFSRRSPFWKRGIL